MCPQSHHSCQSLPFSALFLSPSLFHSILIAPFPPKSVLFSPSYHSHLSLFPASLSNLSLSRSLSFIQITALQLNNALLACQANVISRNQKELICKFRCRGNKKIQVSQIQMITINVFQVKCICIPLFTKHIVSKQLYRKSYCFVYGDLQSLLHCFSFWWNNLWLYECENVK